MKVQDLKNYGKDILTIGSESGIPFRKKLRMALAAAQYLGGLARLTSP